MIVGDLSGLDLDRENGETGRQILGNLWLHTYRYIHMNQNQSEIELKGKSKTGCGLLFHHLPFYNSSLH